MEYHKIQSVYMRDPATKFKSFLVGQWATPEIEYLADNEWEFDEKVDGTNIRVMFMNPALLGICTVRFGGRTDDAQIPAYLYARLQELFPIDKIAEIFPDCENVILYGEGYGAKIQKGGGDYKPDGVDFILFDVRVGNFWLRRGAVEDVAAKLSLNTTPRMGFGTLHTAIEMCREGFASKLRKTPPEGLICRPVVPLFARNGDRVITKVKLKDFSQ